MHTNIRNLDQVPYFGIDSNGQEEWPDPIPLTNGEVPEISASIIPVPWLRDFAEAVTASAQIPPAMAVAVALSTVATCLQKQIEVSPFDDYVEPVNIFTVVQLPPGSRKSQTFSAFTAPLHEWEAAQEKEMQSQIHEIETERTVTLKQIDRLQNEAAKAEDANDREITIRQIKKLKEQLPEPLHAPKLWTGDITPEQLQNLLVEQGERMAVLADEAAIFEIMAGLYSDGRANLDVFLQGHAGSPVRVDRATRQVRLNKPALTFGLTVQPQVLSELASGSKKRFRGVGLLARFLYFAPKSNIGTRDVRRQQPVPPHVRAGYESGIYRLLLERKNPEPKKLTLEPDALELWFQFSDYLEQNQGEGKPLECIQDWTAKLAGAALRIAGLFHACVPGGGSTIDGATTAAAIGLCKLLIRHALVVFDQIGIEQHIADARYLSDWIRQQGMTEFRSSDVYKLGRFDHANKQRLDACLNALSERFVIDLGRTVTTGGRPAKVFRVNPKLR